MISRLSIAFVLFITPVFLAGCTSFHLRGDVQAGRYLLLSERPQQALGHFQRAADQNPDYITDFTEFEEGVWTYIGRAHYGAKEFDKARQALERARQLHRDDFFARLYLGLVLIRQGERGRGLEETASGLRALEAWLRHTVDRGIHGHYWDPSGRLGSEAGSLLAMIEGGDVRSEELLSRAERLGNKLEEETDTVKYERLEEETRDDDDATVD